MLGDLVGLRGRLTESVDDEEHDVVGVALGEIRIGRKEPGCPLDMNAGFLPDLAGDRF